MKEDWLGRWQQGRTGWHEDDGNASLKTHWIDLPADSSVLVPLCGKSRDLVWLESRKLKVAGIELSPLAVAAFFAENHLSYEESAENDFRVYRSTERQITVYCGDYFSFVHEPFDALYDRGALIALPASQRSTYVRHTESLLKPGAKRLVITLEYDQAVVDGPPYAVPVAELTGYWPGLVQVSAEDALNTCPPKFLEAGLEKVIEKTWTTAGPAAWVR
jgi:thiopurine S-methyltransferase